MQNPKCKKSWCILFWLFVLCGCYPVYRMGSQQLGVQKEIPIIRVLIAEVGEVKIEGSGLKIEDSRLKIPYFKANTDGVWIGDKRIEKIKWPVELTSGDEVIKFNGKPYRGEIVVHKGRHKFIVVNRVNVEDYLRGVVPCELRTPEFEALKAQAVACRSFALARIKSNSDFAKTDFLPSQAEEKLYDLTSSVSDQVYGGIGSETDPTDRAVAETHGIVCTYNNEVIIAQYHSTCGGRTRNGGKPYLSSRICHFCASSPHYSWEQEYSLSDISKIGLTPRVGEKVRSLEVCERDKSGRVKSVKVLTEAGNRTIYGEELRNKLGLKSCFFDIRLTGERVRITGRGYGHGIGLCQFGSIGMARKGYNYKSILKYYYKGVKVTKIY